jgi:hypothetical protein
MRVSQELKLMPHLVPKSLWGKSAANLLKRAAWERIRGDALEAARSTCQVCGDPASASDPCHELWDYDDEHGTATLAGLRIQCRNCDIAVHMGRTVARGNGRTALAQLVKVNGMGPREAKILYRSAMDKWKQRNKKEWRIAVAKSLLQPYPELAALEQCTAAVPTQKVRRAKFHEP